jgi:anti-sigma factor RsiW
VTEPERGPPDVHAEALLLPWYVSDTLSEEERARVAAHLETCAACRAELESVRSTRSLLQAGFADAAAPTARAYAAVQQRLAGARAVAARSRPAPQRVHGGWRLAAAFAGLVVVGQFVVLSRGGGPTPGEVGVRGVGPATTRVELVLNPQANAEAVGALLRGLPARVVDGPAADGHYTLELPTTDPARVALKLAELRAHPEVVRDAIVTAR